MLFWGTDCLKAPAPIGAIVTPTPAGELVQAHPELAILNVCVAGI